MLRLKHDDYGILALQNGKFKKEILFFDVFMINCVLRTVQSKYKIKYEAIIN